MPLRDIIDRGTDAGSAVVDEGTDRATDFGSDIRSGAGTIGSGVSTATPTSTSDIPTSLSDLRSSAGTAASGIDSGVRGGAGFIVDNPLVSVQEDVAQRGMTGAFQAGQLVAGEDPSDTDIDDVGEAFADATSDVRSSLGGAVEDTPADNPVTDALTFAGDALVAQPGRNLFGTVTGVDPGDGETDFRPGALEAGELALIGAGGGLFRGGREAGGALSRLGLRSGDDAADAGRVASDAPALPGGAPRDAPALPAPPGATRAADDAATTATRATDDLAGAAASGGITSRLASALPSRATDRVGGLTSRIRGAGRTGDDATTTAARGADDAASAAARTGDDAASAAARTGARSGDDAASAAGRATARTGDDATSAGARTAGRAADDATDGGGLLSGRNIFGVSGRTAAIGGGGLLAGGIAGTMAGGMLSPSEVPDQGTAEMGGVEYAFQLVESLPATDDYPAGADLYVVREAGVDRSGYWVVLGADPDSGDVYLLDSDGDERTAEITSEQLQQGGIMEEEA